MVAYLSLALQVCEDFRMRMAQSLCLRSPCPRVQDMFAIN